MLKIGISGSLGRMSGHVIHMLAQESEYPITALYEPKLNERLPTDIVNSIGDHVGHSSDMAVLKKADCIIDFSHASLTAGIVELAKANGKRLVIGTTGLAADVLDMIKAAAASIPVFYSPNMSYGINFLYAVLPLFMKGLLTFDKEILELHHNRKKDAPSGTALKFFDIMKNCEPKLRPVMSRTEKIVARESDEIGISSMRAGGIAGTHEILFATENEMIELRHTALSRDSLAQGTVEAVKFLEKRGAGYYSYDAIVRERLGDATTD